jgi:hypothetical protein
MFVMVGVGGGPGVTFTAVHRRAPFCILHVLNGAE